METGERYRKPKPINVSDRNTVESDEFDTRKLGCNGNGMQIIRMCSALRRIWDMSVFMGMNFHRILRTSGKYRIC